jgi:hypothetical protein
LLARFPRENEMGMMDRIESAAVDSDFFQAMSIV